MTEIKSIITGLGLVTPAATDLENNYERFKQKKSCAGIVERFPVPQKVQTNIAGLVREIKLQEVAPHLAKLLDEEDLKHDYIKAAVLVTDEAIRDAGISESMRSNPRRTGIIVASSLGNFLNISELIKDYFMENLYKITSLIQGMNSYLPSRLATIFGAKGPCFFVSSSCTSALHAILLADSMLKNNTVDRVIVCSVDICLETGTYHLWNKIRVLSRRNNDPGTACRPYCRTRDGIVIAEAAACFIIERESERKRYARIEGIGMSNGSADFFKPCRDDIRLAMEEALREARVFPDEIDLIVGSGSGSPHCDHLETDAIEQVFGKRAREIPVFSFKSFLGSTFGTQAASEGALALKCLFHNEVPEVRNIFEKDERIRVNVYYDHRNYAGYNLRRILFNNSGFAGNHMSIVYSK